MRSRVVEEMNRLFRFFGTVLHLRSYVLCRLDVAGESEINGNCYMLTVLDLLGRVCRGNNFDIFGNIFTVHSKRDD